VTKSWFQSLRPHHRNRTRFCSLESRRRPSPFTGCGRCSSRIPDGRQATIRITVEPRKPGTFVSSVTVTGRQFDADESNNTDTETTVVTR
jgi:hypothetical protein